ncbi:hypothetical protein AB0J86_04205 [Micromonospora sp. NPDC049559]|uniref:hypothetical protein n=1 Tax=Micromonospora sp. NPDC049559 TaxID=3155923 RepID=UPI00343138FF
MTIDALRRGRLALAAATLIATLAACGDEPAGPAAPSAGPTSAAATATPAGDAPTPTAAPASPPPAATPAVDKEITVTVARKKVTPPTGRVQVAKGNLVRVTVTSDVADELHVHGYDLSAKLPAGKPASIEFRTDRTGLFEVETHETHLVLFQLVVR